MRDIRESTLFSEQCTQLGVGVRRLDDVLESAVWAVANAADDLPTIPGTKLGWIPISSWPGVPEMIVLFRIENDDLVELQWIEIVQQDPDEPTG